MSLFDIGSGAAAQEAAPGRLPIAYVVDDDDALRFALRLELSTSGYRCQAFASASELLSRADQLEPGCIILDIRMPGKNGIELLAELAQRGIHWPTIMVTGHAEAVSAADATRLGAAHFLEKPFSGEALLSAIAQETGKLGTGLRRAEHASRLPQA